MGRKTKVLSLSLSQEMADELEKIAKDKKKTKSDIFKEMFKTYTEYIAEKEWRKLFEFGEETAKRFKIKDEEELFEILNKQNSK